MRTAPFDDGTPAVGGIDFGDGTWSMWGEIDWAVLLRVEDEARRHLAASPEKLVIDVERVTFLDSAGLRLLARAAAATETVRLTGVNEAVLEPLELAGLYSLFEVDAPSA
ncbi:STAS domain-containing protein [Puerhibacterium sp. TATVAM-FAB25]|uniref:STAS domain-containing protein n=1 Tax=Puerhibacterium sp. TATVAM-FAB25 TaxID=3093699 RepID=UPI00397B0B5E